jgi:L,D-transpeptidase catalytic domain/Bacterial Ig-like domain
VPRDGGAALLGVGRPGKQSSGGDSPSAEGPVAPSGPGSNNGGGGNGGDGKGRGGNDSGRKLLTSRRFLVVAGIALAVAIAGGAFALTQHSGSNQPGGGGAAAAAGPIHVQWVTPSNGSTQVDGSNPIMISFSSQIAPDSPLPTLQPSVPGSWSVQGNALVFTPTTGFAPSSKVTVSIPSGPGGVRSVGGGLLTSSVTARFSTGGYSNLRLAQLLAQLGYLPMSWTGNGGIANRMEYAEEAAGQNQSQEALAYDPPAGTFNWETGYPSMLQSMWTSDGDNVLVRGAVMAFESEHNMSITGDVTAGLWNAVFRAIAHNDVNANGYTYAIASKDPPETLTIWHNGRVVMRSLANTGIPVSPTVDGTFPVYQRFRFQIMRGVNPDGSSYADPVSFVSYFNGGDAVHYFPRGSYGWQQSLGCVELPWNSAEEAYPYLTYGSLVTVSG